MKFSTERGPERYFFSVSHLVCDNIAKELLRDPAAKSCPALSRNQTDAALVSTRNTLSGALAVERSWALGVDAASGGHWLATGYRDITNVHPEGYIGSRVASNEEGLQTVC